MSDPIESALGRVAAFLVEGSRARPGVVALLALALTAVSLWAAATRLEVDSDPDRMISAELPYRKTNARIEASFPELVDNLVVVVEADTAADAREAARALAAELARDTIRFSSVFYPEGHPFFEEHGLQYLDVERTRWLADALETSGPLLARLAERPALAELVALVAAGLAGEEPWLEVLDGSTLWLEAMDRTSARWLAGDARPLGWGELLSAWAGGRDGRRQILSVQPTRDFLGFGPARESMSAVRAAAAGLEPRQGLRVRITGDVAVLSEEMSQVQSQMLLVSIASLLLVTAVLVVALRSFRLLLATVVTLLAGLAWTAGFAALAVGHLNVLTTAFAVLYIGLGVDFGIHFALGFRERRAAGDGVPRALRANSRLVGSSLVFCALTTAIGFFAFIPTSYTGVAELGIISGAGVFLSLLATLTLLPALLSLGLGVSRKLEEPDTAALRIGLPSFPLRRPRRVCALAGLAALAGLVAAPKVRFDGDPLNVRDPRVESVVTMVDLLSGGQEAPWTIEVLARDPQDAQAMRPALEALPEVSRVVTIQDFLPSRSEERAALLARAAAGLADPAPGRAASLDEAFDSLQRAWGGRVEADADWDPGLTSLAETLGQVDAARRAGRLPRPISDLERALFDDLATTVRELGEKLATPPVRLDALPPELRRRYVAADGRARVEIFPRENLRVPGALDRFADAVREVRPDAGGAVVGTVEFARAIVRSLRQALGLAVVVIAALLLVLWRSPRYALFALVPLVLGALLTAAVTVAVGLPLNFANVIVLPLILGIGVDSGIHLVHRHRLHLEADVLQTSTARAVFFSALTSLASFASLSLASHRGISSLAGLLVVGLSLVLICNLIVLPALLTWLDPPGGSGRGGR